MLSEKSEEREVKIDVKTLSRATSYTASSHPTRVGALSADHTTE